MNATMIQGIAAAVMIGTASVLFFALRNYMATSSERRMLTMLESVGLDSALITSGNTGAIMNDIRQRCRSCASEAVCERWLSGDEKGDNDFCPNASVFAALKKKSA
jgi:hypothetical protein